jgi:hypothetical protein
VTDGKKVNKDAKRNEKRRVSLEMLLLLMFGVSLFRGFFRDISLYGRHGNFYLKFGQRVALG